MAAIAALTLLNTKLFFAPPRPAAAPNPAGAPLLPEEAGPGLVAKLRKLGGEKDRNLQGIGGNQPGDTGIRGFFSFLTMAGVVLMPVQDNLMKTINVLLASADRRTNNLIQTLVLDVCYNRAAVNCVQTARVDELLARGSRACFDLVIVGPGHLVAEPSRRSKIVSTAEVAQAVGTIKLHSTVPIIAVAVSAEDGFPLLQAGADGVLGLPFSGDALRAEVVRLLPLPPPVNEPQPGRGSMTAFLMRGLQLLKNA
jgi:hypothetical protein